MTDQPIPFPEIKDPKIKDVPEPQMAWLHLHLENFSTSLRTMFQSLDSKYLDYDLQSSVVRQAERITEASKKLSATITEHFNNVNYEAWDALEEKVIARFKLTSSRLTEAERDIRERLDRLYTLKRYVSDLEELVTTIERLNNNPNLKASLAKLAMLLKNTT